MKIPILVGRCGVRICRGIDLLNINTTMKLSEIKESARGSSRKQMSYLTERKKSILTTFARVSKIKTGRLI